MSSVLKDPTSDKKGLRLQCERCGSEIEIVNPSKNQPSGQVFRCCGAAMRPTIGHDIHVGDD
jgi:hypothetical protein